jgi:hypothetical protein
MRRSIPGETSQGTSCSSDFTSLSRACFTWSGAAQLGIMVTFPGLQDDSHLRFQLPKEHIGMVNGTSFSASVGALIAFESVGAIVLGEVSEKLTLFHAHYYGFWLYIVADYHQSQGLHRNGHRSTFGNSSQFCVLH